MLVSIRNHGGVPDIDADAYELEIGGLVNTPVKLSLNDLQNPDKFPYVFSFTLASSMLIVRTISFSRQSEVIVTIQCSGTRRIEQIGQYPGEGDELINAPWGEGAM